MVLHKATTAPHLARLSPVYLNDVLPSSARWPPQRPNDCPEAPTASLIYITPAARRLAGKRRKDTARMGVRLSLSAWMEQVWNRRGVSKWMPTRVKCRQSRHHEERPAGNDEERAACDERRVRSLRHQNVQDWIVEVRRAARAAREALARGRVSPSSRGEVERTHRGEVGLTGPSCARQRPAPATPAPLACRAGPRKPLDFGGQRSPAPFAAHRSPGRRESLDSPSSNAIGRPIAMVFSKLAVALSPGDLGQQQRLPARGTPGPARKGRLRRLSHAVRGQGPGAMPDSALPGVSHDQEVRIRVLRQMSWQRGGGA